MEHNTLILMKRMKLKLSGFGEIRTINLLGSSGEEKKHKLDIVCVVADSNVWWVGTRQ
jgi:hypothetical protein